jgi:hypothetical protein
MGEPHVDILMFPGRSIPLVGDDVPYLDELVVFAVDKWIPIVIRSWTGPFPPGDHLGLVECAGNDTAMVITNKTSFTEG